MSESTVLNLGLKVFKVHPDARFDMKRGDDAGYDLRCLTDIVLPPAIRISHLRVTPKEEPGPTTISWTDNTTTAGEERVYTVSGTRGLFTKEEAMRASQGTAHGPTIYTPTFQVVKIPTGLVFEVPSGYYGQIFDKSSVGIQGVKSYAGVIDPSYRGELHVCLANHTSSTITFAAGSKIAQIIFLPYVSLDIEWVDSADELSSTNRGDGGFGSTGAI